MWGAGSNDDARKQYPQGWKGRNPTSGSCRNRDSVSTPLLRGGSERPDDTPLVGAVTSFRA